MSDPLAPFEYLLAAYETNSRDADRKADDEREAGSPGRARARGHEAVAWFDAASGLRAAIAEARAQLGQVVTYEQLGVRHPNGFVQRESSMSPAREVHAHTPGSTLVRRTVTDIHHETDWEPVE